MTTPVAVTTEFSLFADASDSANFVRVAGLANGSFGIVLAREDIFATVNGALGQPGGEMAFAGAGERPSIAALPDGNAVIVYIDDTGNVVGQISDGTTFTPFDTGALGTQPSVAVLADGNFVVVWQTGTGIAFQAYTVDGNTGGAGGVIPGMYSRPEVTALAGGGFVIGATDATNVPNSNEAAYFIYDKNYAAAQSGTSGPPIASANSEKDVFVIGLLNGGFVSAYTRENNGDGAGNGILYMVHDAQGTKVGTTNPNPQLANTTSPGDQNGAAGCALSDGGFVLVWQDQSAGNWDIRAQVFNSDGTKRDGEFLVATGATDQVTPSVSELADGRLIFAWDDMDGTIDYLPGIRGVIYDPRQSGITRTGTDGPDTYFGTDFADVIRGQDGNDILISTRALSPFLGYPIDADKLEGGNGDDTYIINDSSDMVVETGGLSGGNDTLTSWLVNIDLATAAHGGGNVENAGAINDSSISLFGNAGKNMLDGETFASAGVNAMRGRGGNDTYILGPGDTVNESAAAGGSGVDTATSASRSLNLTLLPGVENATLTNPTFGSPLDLNLTGTAGANVLIGNAGANTISGAGGVDRIVGGLGRDVMTGGAARDIFDFNAVAETGSAVATRDRIADFTHLVDDIDLATIDANGAAAGNTAFQFRAAKGAAFTGFKGQIRWFWENPPGTVNDKTIVQGDINGDKLADFAIELAGLKTLTAADFIL